MQLQYIGARYVPIFYHNTVDDTANWQINVEYEPLTFVTTVNNHLYLSKKTVPDNIGTPAQNTEYWLDMGIFTNAQIAEITERVEDLENEVGDLEDLDPSITDNTSIIDAINFVNDLIAGIRDVTIPAIVEDVSANTTKLLHNKVVNFLDFNPAGDGVTDDTLALNSAISATPIHGTLYIPMGTYKLNSAIEITKPMSIIGDYTGWDYGLDQWSITRDEAMQPTFISAVSQANTEGAFIIKSYGVRIENIAIKCFGTGASNGIYIPALSTYNPGSEAIRNIIIRNVAFWLDISLRGGSRNSAILSDAPIIVSEFDHVWSYNFACGIYLTAGGTSCNFNNCWVINACAVGFQLTNVHYSNFNACACDCSQSTSRCVYGYRFNGCVGVTVNGCGAEKMNIAMMDIINYSLVSVNGCKAYDTNVSQNSTGGFAQMDGTSKATFISCDMGVEDVSYKNLVKAPSGANFNILSCQYRYLVIGTTSTHTPNATYINNRQMS